ncbi:MAG TPA: S16 family serine protease [Jatrophihabitans sp.]|nr:S16 family serine protease [Jatrophihabitans sp.]
MRFDAGQVHWSPPKTFRAQASGNRKGRLPVAAVRPDYELTELNGSRLSTPGHPRPTPAGAICAVSYRAELRPTAWEILSHLVDPHASVVARSRLTGRRRPDDFEAGGLDEAAWSMDSAAAAAARLLGQPVTETGAGAQVEALRDDTVDLKLQDIITAVNGRPVITAVQLRAALAGLDDAELVIERQPGPADPAAPVRMVVPISRHDDGAWGIRVVTARRQLQHGLTATFDLPEDLRGPSLGLSCALSILDAYTGGQLAAGGTVVATGTVDLAGRVGGVGAIRYKARAVRAHPHVRRFLVPADPTSDVEDARQMLGSRVEVVAVATLAEAAEILLGFSLHRTSGQHRSSDRLGLSTAR